MRFILWPVSDLWPEALLTFRRGSLPRWATASALTAATVVTVVMGWTANLGGQVRHTEVRSDASTAAQPAGVALRESHDEGRRWSRRGNCQVSPDCA